MFGGLFPAVMLLIEVYMNTQALLVMAIPALVALGGGVLAAVWHPTHQMRSLIQHFAAGVVLAALAVELLPGIGREHAPGLVLVGAFALGSLFMYGLKLWTMRLEHQAAVKGAAPGLGIGLLLATFIDVATDGFIIGAGFAVDEGTGAILALGLSVELLFLGMALASEATAGWRIIAISGALGGSVLTFSLIGNALLTGASHAVIGGALAFSAAALLYLVTEELLMEAHTVEEKPISTLVLFGGFLAFWSIQLLGQ
jgi:ZIP family zinc transporter